MARCRTPADGEDDRLIHLDNVPARIAQVGQIVQRLQLMPDHLDLMAQLARLGVDGLSHIAFAACIAVHIAIIRSVPATAVPVHDAPPWVNHPIAPHIPRRCQQDRSLRGVNRKTRHATSRKISPFSPDPGRKHRTNIIPLPA
ncbi:hypothetical protein [Bifidobacterium bifidum]|uniref:hypothetical protein n=1 Tax=Bifidobacterium bifidum TaxID=1681 RepID=UPI001C220488|nr:hypothetical protein [Bifidobacterium bifidum]